MGAVWKYWQLVRINSAGGRKVEEIPAAKAFFHQQFPELAGVVDVPDTQVQRHLLQLMRTEAMSENTIPQQMAQRCLRCFISHQIDRVCGELEVRFGEKGGFTRTELLSLVLDDVDVSNSKRNPQEPSSTYQSLATRILQTFDPEQSQLSTWAKHLVVSRLNAFLLECGVYLASDWSILNGMTTGRLQRLLTEVYLLTPTEIERSHHLLESYHAIYRQDHIQQRKPGSCQRCSSPTPQQLNRMLEYLRAKGMHTYSQEQVMHQLQILADRIRQSRTPQLESLDAPESHPLADERQACEPHNADSHNEFLTRYRQEFRNCLEQTIEQVVSDRLAYHRKKKPPSDEQFLRALHLFYCQHQSMGEIAAQIGLHKQYQVSRLLELKPFRADVRQKMLVSLRDRCRELAADYINPTQLENLEQRLDAVLEEEIDNMIEADKTDASTPNRFLNNLNNRFARSLCRHIDNWRFEQ
jgi:hypothetical protein